MSYAAAATGVLPPELAAIATRSKRNIVLNEMKNKCSNSNGTSTTTEIAAAAADQKPITPPIAERLLACLENEDIRDLELIGRDGVRVPALRCVVASASPVLERMLYGQFSEATRSDIEMGEDCSSKALEALVEFCCSDRLTIDTRWKESNKKELIEDLLSVARLGHTYAIPGLQDAAQDYIFPRLQDDPSLACLVFEGSHPISTPELHAAASETIRTRPYVALKSPPQGRRSESCNNEDESSKGEEEREFYHGGIVCLSPEKLEEVLSCSDVEAEELYLFQLLVDWKNYNENLIDDDVNEICQRVVRHLRLACIDPQDLRNTVLTAGFVSQDQILQAFMEQACFAQEEGMTFASFRGQDPERGHVLVQGAGYKGCNGIYTQQKEVAANPSLLYYVKPDNKKKNVTYYIIKEPTDSWKICLNATVLYEWKAYNNHPSGSRKYHDESPSTGWSLPSASGGLPSTKLKLPVPTCKFFRRPRNENTHVSSSAPLKSLSA